MREIKATLITEAVKRMCIEANCHLSCYIKDCIRASYEKEDWPQAKEILERIIENFEISDNKSKPVCQDTGVACVFLNIGQDVHIAGEGHGGNIRAGKVDLYEHHHVAAAYVIEGAVVVHAKQQEGLGSLGMEDEHKQQKCAEDVTRDARSAVGGKKGASLSNEILNLIHSEYSFCVS